MRICLLTDKPDHPVLGAAVRELAQRFPVTVCGSERLRRDAGAHGADLYLLKARTREAVQFAAERERAGAIVLNAPAATAACLDRLELAEHLSRAGVATPATTAYPSLRDLAEAKIAGPLVVKSRRSRPGDLVTVVRSEEELSALLPTWGGEPVIAQQLVAGDGSDVKAWAIGTRLWMARRPSTLDGPRTAERDRAVDPDRAPEAWARTVREAGAALGLALFGVDLLVVAGRPVVVDVNAFPGFRSAPGAADALVSLVASLDRGAGERRTA